MFEFWRDCRYQPCRSVRRCSGDQGYCLQSRSASVPYDVGVVAQIRMLAELPPNADRFARPAYRQAHSSPCLHDPKNQKRRAKTEAKPLAPRNVGAARASQND
jgi:hypothetical protein